MTQGTERIELWRNGMGAAPEMKLCWWYQADHDDNACEYNDAVLFESLAPLQAAMQAAIDEHDIALEVTAGETASGQQCIVVTRGERVVAGQLGSDSGVGTYARFVKRFTGPPRRLPHELMVLRKFAQRYTIYDERLARELALGYPTVQTTGGHERPRHEMAST